MQKISKADTKVATQTTVLVLGANGMLGHMLVRVLRDRHSVIGSVTGNYESLGKLKQVLRKDECLENLNATNLVDVTRCIDQTQPDVILNCVGLTKHKMDAKSAFEVILVNSVLPHHLAEICNQRRIRVIHFSTDCVFSCRSGTKRLSDVPDASDVYGVTKRLGEIKCGTSLTLRTSFVGRQLSGIEQFFEWVISQRGKSVNGYQRAIYSGLTTQALAGVVSRLIDEHDELVGLYQVASKPISKFELITNLNELLELHLEVEPDSSYVCDRSLDGSEFRDVTGIQVPSWETMLTNFANDQAFYA
jgi:dTDP-4-dehydrorhamnose reductase